MRIQVSIAAILWLAACCAASARNAALDDDVVALYTLTKTSVTVNCRFTGASSCQGFTRLHPPFESACAVLEGAPSTNGNVISRDIYVLDKRVSDTDVVNLYVYARTDTFNGNDDTLSVALKAKVPLTTEGGLSVTGGNDAHCLMVASDTAVFAGTTAYDHAAVVDKNTLGIALTGAGGPLTSLFVDDRGYVSVNAQNGFLVLTPAGHGIYSGPGHELLVGTHRAVTFDDAKLARKGNRLR